MQDLLIKVADQYISPISLGVKRDGEYITADTLFIKDNNIWNAFKTYRIPDNAIFWVDDAGYGSDALLCDGTSGTTDCIDAFMSADATAGSKTGSDSHASQNSTSTSTGSTDSTAWTNTWNSNPAGGSTSSHNHGFPAHSHGSVDHKPPYYSLIPIMINSNKLKVAFKPILLYRFNTIPYGWEAFSAADGRFIRNEIAAGNVGGSHNHTHSTNTANVSTRNFTGGPGTDFDYSHTGIAHHDHGGSHAAAEVATDPTKVTLQLLKALKTTSAAPTGSVLFFDSAITHPCWKICDGSLDSPNYISAMIIVGGSVNETITGSSVHTDSSAAATTGSRNATYSGGATTSSSTSNRLIGNHTHSLPAHTHGTTNPSLPVHIPLIPGWKTK